MEEDLIQEFQLFHIQLESGSSLLDRLRDLAVEHGLTAAELCEEWMAHAAIDSRELTDVSCESWAIKLSTRNKSKNEPMKKKKKKNIISTSDRTVHTKSDINILLADDLIGQYGTQDDLNKCGVKRSSEEATPPSSTHKIQATENGATPIRPLSRRQNLDNGTPTTGHNGSMSSTPVGSYSQRKNSRAVVCTLNERIISTDYRHGNNQHVNVSHYDSRISLTAPYHHMFQKISDKGLVLLERTEELGEAICHHHNLPDPSPLSQPSLDSGIYVGRIVCDSDGHLNASSCLLEGVVKSRTLYSHCVKLEIPPSVPCSLFPGQVVVVEGINNHNGCLISSNIYDQGVYPPLPKREHNTIGGFTALIATGPFSTSDSLNMTPLNDIITITRKEQPDILLLMGPFIDINNSIVKTGCLPDDMTFQEFFTHHILEPLLDCVRGQRTQLLMIPAQRDVHHSFEVYPQPPFQDTINKQDKGHIMFLSDPCTLAINGICMGVTSTDILFHLSARTMFRGPSPGDRMARLAEHILRQRSYYPLLPPYHKEEVRTMQVKSDPTTNSDIPHPHINEVSCDVSIDYIQAFEEGKVTLPVRPDILILPSDLKPFIKVLEGCVCVNPGHLTRRLSGGTFCKLVIPELPAKPDISSDCSLTVIHI